MPSSQEINQVKENLADLKIFFSDVYTQGRVIIPQVFESLGLIDDKDLKLITTVNMYTNALIVVNNQVSLYLGAAIGGFLLLTPQSLNGSFYNVMDCYDKTYQESLVSLNNYETNTENHWYNYCTGTIYTPNGFSTPSVELSQLASTQFFKKTDPIYQAKLDAALISLEQSLRYSLTSNPA